jgi:hypothetical protein
LVLSFLSKGCGEAADILAAQLRISGNEQLHLPGQHRARLLCASQCSLPKSVKAASQGRRRCHRRSVPKPLSLSVLARLCASPPLIPRHGSLPTCVLLLIGKSDQPTVAAQNQAAGCTLGGSDRMHTWWVRQVGQDRWRQFLYRLSCL